MALAKLQRVGSAVLHSPSARIKPGDSAVMQARVELHDVLAAFREQHGFGRAISAPQIGHPMRMIALNLNGNVFTMHNPLLDDLSDKQVSMWDDCFSFPDYLVKVRRHALLRLTFEDDYGRKITVSPGKDVVLGDFSLGMTAPLSELIQHEVDHLDGITAFDRMLPSSPGQPSVIHRTVYEANKAHFDAMVDYSIPRVMPGIYHRC